MNIVKRAAILLFVLFVFSAGAVTAETVSVDNRSTAPQVMHGVKKLVAGLEAAGYTVDEGKAADLKITVEGPVTSGVEGPAVPLEPESYAVSVAPGAVHIAGSDAVGAMYGAYDVLEQIEMNGLAGVEARAKSPFLRLRGTNPFFHIQAFEDQNSWYYDEKYWETYLDELSLSRHNLLDIHAMYDLVTTGFPNAFLYLIKSEKFPDTGVSAEQAEKNLAMFNRIIEMADERGIKVSLMSYHAGWHMPGREGVDWPTDKELEDYTAEVVTKIIDACPKLWMVGFRIGESGRKADFFQKSYIRGIKEASRDINLFTRTWVSPVESVLAIADAYPGRTYLEMKYNGEHLGLPYHAFTSTTVEYNFAPSYSYENYPDWPRNYEILWQIRANGTHRLFRWGDPEFTRRTMLSCAFADAAGYTMEPFSSYFPPTDFFHKDHADFDYFTWDHQRNWFWYESWGRNAYDPETPESVWLNMFEKRFGAEAARDVYDTWVWMSRIVPLIYSYNYLGPDHRMMAPEFEFGGSTQKFSINTPLEPIQFQPSDDFADAWLARNPRAQAVQGGKMIETYTFEQRMDKNPYRGGKIGPLEFAELMETYVAKSEEAAARARLVLGDSSKEFNDIDLERRLLKGLGLYYSNKFRAAIHYYMFMRTLDPEQRSLARTYTTSAHAAWDYLATEAEKGLRPFPDMLQMKTLTFTWREEGEKLKADFEALKEMDNAWELFKEQNSDEPVLTHLPPYGPAKPGTPLTLHAGVTTPADKVSVRLVNREGTVDYSAAMKPTGPDSYVVTIPDYAMKEGAFRYSFTVEAGGKNFAFPQNRGKQSWFNLLVSNDDAGPVAELMPLADVKQDSGKIRFRITDASGVERARLYHKPIPSQLFWEFSPMTPVEGEDGVWEAEVELTSHGLLYYVASEDKLGNISQYPNGLIETPYLVLESWKEPNVNPYME